MLLAQLEVVVEVARLGSLSQAADALSLTQPAVSWRLRALETELGTPLFVRTRRGVRPTGAGAALLPHAQRTVQAANEATRAAREYQDTAVETMVVAAAAGPSLTVLPEAVLRLYRRHPKARLTIHTGFSESVADMVAQGVATLGVAAEIQHPDLESVPLFDDDFVLVVGGKRRRGPTTVADLEGRTFVELEARANDDRQIAAAMRVAKIKPRRLLTVDTTQAAKEIVTRGLGFAFLPRSHLTADLKNGLLHEVDLHGTALPTRHIVALRRTDAGPMRGPTKTLIDDLRELGSTGAPSSN
jgi:DNA-binding transcriptional LysR family regulator